MNLFEEVRPYIQMKELQPAKIVDDLIKVKVNNFDDAVELYIRCCSILKYYWVMKIDSIKINVFNKNKFDSYLLKLWVMSRDNAFVLQALKRSTWYLCWYIQSRLLNKNPQFKYFQAFARGNLEKMDLVFKVKSCRGNKEALIVYESSNGNLIEIMKDWEMNSFKWEQVDDMLNSNLFSETERIDLEYALSKKGFAKKRKIIFEAAKFKYKGWWNPMEEKSILSLI